MTKRFVTRGKPPRHAVQGQAYDYATFAANGYCPHNGHAGRNGHAKPRAVVAADLDDSAADAELAAARDTLRNWRRQKHGQGCVVPPEIHEASFVLVREQKVFEFNDTSHREYAALWRARRMRDDAEQAGVEADYYWRHAKEHLHRLRSAHDYTQLRAARMIEKRWDDASRRWTWLPDPDAPPPPQPPRDAAELRQRLLAVLEHGSWTRQKLVVELALPASAIADMLKTLVAGYYVIRKKGDDGVWRYRGVNDGDLLGQRQ